MTAVRKGDSEALGGVSAATAYRQENPGKKAAGEKDKLLRKLQDLARKLDRIEKRGHNEAQDYNYVRASDVLEAVRKELLDLQITIIPHVDNCHTTEVDRQILTTAELRYEIRDLETQESIYIHWAGAGADVGDKGLYKAITGGLKYFLLNLFLIPTGDDPENEGPVREKPKREAAPKIPNDRYKKIVRLANDARLVDGRGLKAVLKAKLQALGVTTGKLSDVNVDQAEELEDFLTREAK